jgi:hypothetical protein
VAGVRALAEGVAIVARRTPIQLALAAMGLIVWGYGARVDDSRLTLIGLVFFAVAFLLRFWKQKDRDNNNASS